MGIPIIGAVTDERPTLVGPISTGPSTQIYAAAWKNKGMPADAVMISISNAPSNKLEWGTPTRLLTAVSTTAPALGLGEPGGMPTLYAAWKDSDSNRILYSTSIDGIHWETSQIVPGAATASPPFLSPIPGLSVPMAIVWRDLSDLINYALFPADAGWQGPFPTGHKTKDGPALTWTGGVGTPVIVWRELTGNQLYYCEESGAAQKISGAQSTVGPGAAGPEIAWIGETDEYIWTGNWQPPTGAKKLAVTSDRPPAINGGVLAYKSGAAIITEIQ